MTPRLRLRVLLRRLALMIAMSLLVGMAYQTTAQYHDRRTLPPPGTFHQVNGGRMHLLCASQGRPTVVLEAGAMWFAQTWYWIQRDLASRARVCSYDRAGLGWSDLSEAAHDGNAVARNLKALLDQSGESGPYVLIGHSLGGAFVRIFAGLYPEDTLAVGLVDPTHPDQLQRLGVRAQHERSIRLLGGSAVLAYTGLLRILNPIVPTLDGLPESVHRTGRMFFSSPRHLRASRAEMAEWDRTMHAAREIKDLGDRPLVVISSTRAILGMTEEMIGRERLMHEELSALSRRGRHVVIPDANHYTLVTDETSAGLTIAVLGAFLDTIKDR